MSIPNLDLYVVNFDDCMSNVKWSDVYIFKGYVQVQKYRKILDGVIKWFTCYGVSVGVLICKTSRHAWQVGAYGTWIIDTFK